MRHLFPRPKSRTAVALGLTLVLHFALLVALLLWRPPDIVRESQPLTIALSDYPRDGQDEPAAAAAAAPSAPVVATPPPPQERPSDAPPPPVVQLPALGEPILGDPGDFAAMAPDFTSEPDPEISGDAPMVGVESQGAGAAGSACPLVATLRAILERDPEARAALARIPNWSLSVANAILLWDGTWIEPRRVGGPAAVAAVRAAVAGALSRAPQACRDEVIVGPVFLPVNTGARTVVVALGSGSWTWTQLLPPIAGEASVRVETEPE